MFENILLFAKWCILQLHAFLLGGFVFVLFFYILSSSSSSSSSPFFIFSFFLSFFFLSFPDVRKGADWALNIN